MSPTWEFPQRRLFLGLRLSDGSHPLSDNPFSILTWPRQDQMEDTSASSAAQPIPFRRQPSSEDHDLLLSRSCPTNVMDNPHQPLEASASSSIDSDGSIHTFGTPLNAEGQSRPGRPRIRNLMASPPMIPRRGKSMSHTRPSTMFASFSRSPRREWSVFEQRMENEGQMRTRSTLRESVNESAVHSPLRQTSRTPTRSESPIPGTPRLQRVVVNDHESETASTIGYDSESDDEGSSRRSTPAFSPPLQKRRWYTVPKLPSLTPLQRKILKCAVAYFIGSLFTFNSTLSNVITSVISTGDESAPSQSGHMVATV